MTQICYNRLITDLPSEAYHAHKGTYSSSQLKYILEDPELFYRMYIEKSIPRSSTGSMDVGTYVHTAVLEPEKLAYECAVYEGKVRSGRAWEAFKEANANKVIITSNDLDKASDMIAAINSSPIARSYIDGYDKEVSCFIEVYVMINFTEKEKSVIYSFDKEGDCHRITNIGWVYCSMEEDEKEAIKEFGHRLVLKVRADSVNFAKKSISDVKTTSVNPLMEAEVRGAIDTYSYDLSASFYLDMFSMGTGIKMEEFVWIFTSKTTKNSKSWSAKEDNILVGRAKWRNAVILIAFYESTGWQFSDSLGHIGPSSWQREWLTKFED